MSTMPDAGRREEVRRLRLWIPECAIPGTSASQLLYPFVGSTVDHDGYDEFATRGHEIFARAESDAADFAGLPFDGNILFKPRESSHVAALQFARGAVAEAAARGLKTIVVANIDVTDPVPLPQEHVIVLRPSLLASTKRDNEYSLPAWHDDLFRRYCPSGLLIRDWVPRPSVGFCGLAGVGKPPLTRRIKTALQRLGVGIPHNDGIWLRAAAMEALASDGTVETAFIARHHYFGGPAPTDDTKERSRREYVDNLLGSDYALCVRGWGNHSFRAYEALSLGRPLLLLDTDCVLPLQDLIDYDTIAVRVAERDLADLATCLVAAHGELNAAEFKAKQLRAREIWKRFLRPMAYYRQLAKTLLLEGYARPS